MGTIMIAAITASIILLSTYVIYKWLLASEKQPGYNRLILMACYAVALPVGLLMAYSPALSANTHPDGGLSVDEALAALTQAGATTDASTVSDTSLLPTLLLYIWLGGTIYTGIRVCCQWMAILRTVRNGQVIRYDGHTLVLCNDNSISPFSYGRTIVMSTADYAEAGEMIMSHELKHIACHHSVDLMIALIHCIVMWFNPASWLMLAELRSVHEFQADRQVLAEGTDTQQYQLLLIKKAVGPSFAAIANSLNHSNLKKRITMMSKSNSASSRRWRALALVPAIAAALSVTSIPAVANMLGSLSGASLVTGISSRKVSNSPTNTQTHTLPDSGAASTTDKEPEIYVNGVKLTADELATLPSDQIAQMTVDKSGDTPSIQITLKEDTDMADTLAQFPGGEQAMYQWLSDNIVYPEPDVKDGEETPDLIRIVVRFEISSEGKVSNPSIVKGGPEAYNAEALRVVAMMPDFTPAKSKGKPIDTKYVLPINFRAQ